MSTTKLTRSTASLLLALGCSGLDPDAFTPRGAPPEPDGAGWSFDAGVAPDAGGGSPPIARGGSGPAVADGGEAEPDAGEGGGSDGGGGSRAAVGGGGTGSGGIVSGNGGRAGSASGSGGALRGGGAGSSGSGPSTGGRGQAGGGSAGVGQSGAGGGASPEAHAVFFSEYVEGSSSYKALELTAREDSTLAGCRLVTYFNGATMGTGIALDGSLAAGSAYVLCSSALGPLLETACTRTTNLTFNGDDAIALECDGVTIDAIGQFGVDPGDAWTGGEASTLNQTLRRLCTTSLGDRDGSNAFDPATEWAPFPIDTFDGLGSAECPINASR